jgi:RHS repeat-associated protein
MSRVKRVINFFILLGLFMVPFNFAFSASTNYRYTGQELDKETDLYYYGQRYYNPNTGRFTQKDPVLKDGSIDANFLNKATKEELYEFLSNPQKLNEYSYVLNNPVKYVDPTGETEVSALLTPKKTATQVAFWLGVINGRLRPTGRNISAGLLQHSLNLRIGNNLDLNVHQGNDQNNIIGAIKQSNDYQDYIQDIVDKAEGSGKNQIDVIFDNVNGPSLTFNSGDLETSLRGTHSTHIIGTKLENGEWDINVNITDVYDFKIENYDGDLESMVGNNAAVISQSQGVISNYDININFNDRVRYE